RRTKGKERRKELRKETKGFADNAQNAPREFSTLSTVGTLSHVGNRFSRSCSRYRRRAHVADRDGGGRSRQEEHGPVPVPFRYRTCGGHRACDLDASAGPYGIRRPCEGGRNDLPV